MDENAVEPFAKRLEAAEARIRDLENRIAALYGRLTDRMESLPNLLPKFFREDEVPEFGGGDEPAVDVLVTVKNTYDYIVPCLESLLANTDVPFRLFLNNDASSDIRTTEYLRDVKKRHPEQVRLFEQSESLGFVDAVNLMLKETTNDVVLVNSDTVMPPGWASRLLWPIRHSGEKVASCTPFTNSGPYVAFPCINEERPLFGGMEVNRLDKLFRLAKPTCEFVMPTGYGFCMAMSRAALDAVGTLDAETFRPGYCEEIDWCCRADAAGFKNVAVPNVFVYHKHGATMGREPNGLRERLVREHRAIVVKRYPALEHRIHAFVDDPSYQAYRSYLLFIASAAASEGVTVFFDQKAAMAAYPEKAVVVVSQDDGTGEYRVCFAYKEWSGCFTSPNLNWVIKLLYRVRVVGIHILGLSPMAEREKVSHALRRLGEKMGCRVEGLE